MLGENYYLLKDFAKGNEIIDFVANDCVENLTWYFQLSGSKRKSMERRIGENFGLLNHVLSIADKHGQTELVQKYMPAFEKFAQRVRM